MTLRPSKPPETLLFGTSDGIRLSSPDIPVRERISFVPGTELTYLDEQITTPVRAAVQKITTPPLTDPSAQTIPPVVEKTEPVSLDTLAETTIAPSVPTTKVPRVPTFSAQTPVTSSRTLPPIPAAARANQPVPVEHPLFPPSLVTTTTRPVSTPPSLPPKEPQASTPTQIPLVPPVTVSAPPAPQAPTPGQFDFDEEDKTPIPTVRPAPSGVHHAHSAPTPEPSAISLALEQLTTKTRETWHKTTANCRSALSCVFSGIGNAIKNTTTAIRSRISLPSRRILIATGLGLGIATVGAFSHHTLTKQTAKPHEGSTPVASAAATIATTATVSTPPMRNTVHAAPATPASTVVTADSPIGPLTDLTTITLRREPLCTVSAMFGYVTHHQRHFSPATPYIAQTAVRLTTELFARTHVDHRMHDHAEAGDQFRFGTDSNGYVVVRDIVRHGHHLLPKPVRLMTYHFGR